MMDMPRSLASTDSVSDFNSHNGNTLVPASHPIEVLDEFHAGEITKFYGTQDHPNIYRRHPNFYAQAARSRNVTVMRNLEGSICASVIAWKHNNALITETGSVRNAGPSGYRVAELLMCLQVIKWAFEPRDLDSQLVCGVFSDNEDAKRLFMSPVLGFQKWGRPSESFKTSMDEMIIKDERTRPIEYFLYDPSTLDRQIRHITHIVETGCLPSKEKDSKGNPESTLCVELGRHPISRLVREMNPRLT